MRHYSRFASPRYGWLSQKKTLEMFLQNHGTESVKEFAKAGLHGNGWKTVRGSGVHV